MKTSVTYIKDRTKPFNPPNTMKEWLMVQLQNAFKTKNIKGIKRLNKSFIKRYYETNKSNNG